MLSQIEDCAKRRLTEPAELMVATEFLLERGFGPDEVAVQLTRFYYIDMDALNEVLAALPADILVAHQSWRKVA